MLKVFLVEDERIIRETLRDTLPWAQRGYDFVGEASDGEMALPLIREKKPDVLITDIRMPFMDGLTLSRLVLQELPGIKVIILSGYDDFEYAQQAISLGVERYLLKPITKTALLSVLDEVKAKIEGERMRRSYIQRFQQEAQDYEHYARRRFFEQMVLGQLSLRQIREGGHQLGIELDADSYNIAMVSVPAEQHNGGAYSETGARIREELVSYFLQYPEYVLFRWNLTTYAILMRGRDNQMQMLRDRCIDGVRNLYEAHGPEMNWHVAVGQPVDHLERLPVCFEGLSRLWAYRYMDANRHILTGDDMTSPQEGAVHDLGDLDESKIHSAVITGVLQSASIGEIPGFVEEFLSSLGHAPNFQPFCQYLMLNARFAATAFIRTLDIEPQAYFSEVGCFSMVGRNVTREELKQYLTEVLLCAVQLRDQTSGSQCRNLLKLAVSYIDANYQREDISLNKVAQKVNISANYLSAVFSQEMGTTFVEYLTAKRMEKARELLRTSDLRSGEIALAVGYKDPHYFSFLFKKTQGCTPRDYRAGKGKV